MGKKLKVSGWFLWSVRERDRVIETDKQKELWCPQQRNREPHALPLSVWRWVHLGGKAEEYIHYSYDAFLTQVHKNEEYDGSVQGNFLLLSQQFMYDKNK